MKRRNFLLAAPAFIAAPMLMKVRAPVWTEPLVFDIETLSLVDREWRPVRLIKTAYIRAEYTH